MKIDDIIKPVIRTTTRVPKNKDFWKKRNSRLNFLGNGMWSSVYQSESEPDKVYKVPKYPDDPRFVSSNTGFDEFAQYVLQNQNHNPFLPKIYCLKIKYYVNEFPVCEYKMEKLWPATSFPLDELLDYCKKIINIDCVQKSYKNEGIRQLNSYKGIGDRLSDAIINNHHCIKDRKLKEIVERFEHLSDALDDNLLFRKTPNGPQLVLSDPIG